MINMNMINMDQFVKQHEHDKHGPIRKTIIIEFTQTLIF